MTTSTWHRFQDADIPDEGRVRAAVVDGRPVALSRCGGHLGALENSCPHQGGPLGEGSIEKGLLHCPWHGYDYDPLTGVPPGDFADAVPAFPVQEPADGTWVELPDLPERLDEVEPLPLVPRTALVAVCRDAAGLVEHPREVYQVPRHEGSARPPPRRRAGAGRAATRAAVPG